MIRLTGKDLDARALARIASGEPISLCEEALARVAENRAVIQRILDEGRTVYGINTGFGQFATVVIPPSQLAQLQLNLVRSHAAGVGEPLPQDQTRALMAARINCLLKAHSGIRPEPIRLLAECLNRGVLPVVPSQGSVGASGDLAPLAHMALLLVGEGLAWDGAGHLPGGEALAKAGLRPITLEPKEGLALINGTQLITALGNLAVARLQALVPLSDEIAALSLEALRGTRAPYDPRIHQARPHPGQIEVAARMLEILGPSSEIAESHKDCHRVQDAYSLRCIPQVHGVVRDALGFASQILQRELNSATDNPMIFTDTQESRSGGNFHGQYPAFACDLLAIAACDLASISERRQERLVNPAYSDLPAFEAPGPPRLRGHHPHQRGQGGPREHGPHRRPEALEGRGRPGAGPGPGGPHGPGRGADPGHGSRRGAQAPHGTPGAGLPPLARPADVRGDRRNR